MTTVTWRELRDETVARLAAAAIDSPEHEAQWIVQEAAGSDDRLDPSEMDRAATARGVAHLDRMVARRLDGEPLQYVLGRWPFRTIDLMVDHRVLIPRPETEVVAGRALAEVDRIAAAGRKPLRVVDLGTGSGAIGLAILAERRGAEVTLTDLSPDALTLARSNLVGLGRRAAGASIAAGSWFDALDDAERGRLDLIVSNPPYVADDEALPAVVRGWEPAEALRAGPGGTEALDLIVDGAFGWLRPGGALVLECAPHQADTVAARAAARGYRDAETFRDLAGRRRGIVARM